MFRASPWITYDPPASDNQTPSQQLDNDTEMDAPQISTLHDDGESPPSNASPARTGKFRVKLLINEARMGTKFITFNGETGEEAGIGEEAEEDEPEEDEEEDQLIDDQDDASAHAASTSGTVPARAGTKRPAAKTKSSQAKRKVRPSAPSAPTPALQATTAPPEPQTSPPKDVPEPPTLDHSPSVPQAASAPPASKKKAIPKGTTAAQRAPRKSAPTKPPKTAAAPVAAIPPPSDAAADFSEGHAGTVPSSPAHIDARTPEPEVPAPSNAASISVAPAPEQSTVTLEDLDDIPHPRYPLPTKPFQVQPPPKISTGYAPVVPLDRTKTKPRHWRLAHREVRGIAGGRWFARAWVGEKESELAVAAEAALSVPKLPALSVSAPVTGGRASGKRKPKVDAVSTAASSRSASAAPEAAAPPAPPQRSAIKRSALSTTVATSEADMDIDVS
ncbi:hypothetical protein EDB92DRAFT_1945528 [Lactarius akahatsu]|uniref:Uncharacterized protein n=1 Tax=Lactarius akahatsu TaxID=416441 RepID=A0AAD4QAY1_9AGAM|nr:hypothetical protein EDB92DRAFT_1945528 [Lactarius akahatsu]